MKEAPKIQPADVTPEAQRGPHKLVVFTIDDDPDTLELLKRQLGSRYELYSFSDPLRALAESEELMPELILLDLEMPHINGFEALNYFQQHPYTQSVPVLMVSATNDFEIRRRISESGAIGLIQKPLNIKLIERHIEGFIENLVTKISSSNDCYTCYLSHNEHLKYKEIRSNLDLNLKTGEKIIFLAWVLGADFIDETLRPYIDNEQLVFLEIKSNLVIKFPYLQDLSILFQDIESLITGDLKDYRLVFDEPRNLFDLQDKENALSRTLSLSKLIHLSFTSADIYFTKSSDRTNHSFVLKVARNLVGFKL